MNAKKCKELRRAAQYRNQTATPGVMDFPGIARMVKAPMFSKHTAIKTCYHRLPMDSEVTKVFTEVTKLDVDKHGKPVMVLEKDPTTGLIGPKYELQANSKPGKLRGTEPKGVYRAMKKFVRRFGFDALTFAARQDFIQGQPA